MDIPDLNGWRCSIEPTVTTALKGNRPLFERKLIDHGRDENGTI